MNKWDRRFLELAAFIARWSKDPSTQVGAVIVDPQRMIVSTGFNGLPRKMFDSVDILYDKDTKYQLIIHGEMNAILCAPRSVVGCTLYTYPFASCSRCASMVVQAGIRRVVAPICKKEPEHWIHESIKQSSRVFTDTGVRFEEFPFDLALMVDSR